MWVPGAPGCALTHAPRGRLRPWGPRLRTAARWPLCRRGSSTAQSPGSSGDCRPAELLGVGLECGPPAGRGLALSLGGLHGDLCSPSAVHRPSGGGVPPSPGPCPLAQSTGSREKRRGFWKQAARAGLRAPLALVWLPPGPGRTSARVGRRWASAPQAQRGPGRKGTQPVGDSAPSQGVPSPLPPAALTIARTHSASIHNCAENQVATPAPRSATKPAFVQ